MMKGSVRLDKFLADAGIGTRSEVKIFINKGRVLVDGVIIKDSSFKINIDKSEVRVDNKLIEYSRFDYFMLNKPAGVVSATVDNFSETVIDLIKEGNKKDIFPVGRLDKDTEGLLLLTNDGELAHNLLSPKKHVGKVYYAKVNGVVTENEIKKFEEGLQLEEDFITLPAKLKILEPGEISCVEITIYEGKFHQVKRMFEAVGMEVIYLKRLSMGELTLDSTLALGEYRRLTEQELSEIRR
ncbi:MAG: ribosomal small subunit pseudouridine synthase [Anaerocolumna sp.]|jgi:16S rRNA pseudouridine516 synthase|nr:ribosomal small subunit pseudouridine synthase [Anaerocolumna sp.]